MENRGKLLYELEFYPTLHEVESAAKLTRSLRSGMNGLPGGVLIALYAVWLCLLIIGLCLTLVFLPDTYAWFPVLLILSAVGIAALVRIRRIPENKHLAAMFADCSHGVRIELYEHCMLARFGGAEHEFGYTAPYVTYSDGFMLIDFSFCFSQYAAVPKRIADEHPRFAEILCERIEAVRTQALSDPALRPADLSHGRDIMQAEYNAMNIRVRRLFGITELVVDGMVYAERRGIIEGNYIIGATVRGVRFAAMLTNGRCARMTLFADDKVLAEKLRAI